MWLAASRRAGRIRKRWARRRDISSPSTTTGPPVTRRAKKIVLPRSRSGAITAPMQENPGPKMAALRMQSGFSAARPPALAARSC